MTSQRAEIRLTDPEQIKVLASPIRSRMLEAFERGPRTIKEIAEAMGKAPDRLYYHLRQLETHGLVEVDSEEIAGGKVERRYRLAAQSIAVAPTGRSSRAMAASLIGNVFERAEREIAEVVKEREDLASEAGPNDQPPLREGVRIQLSHMHLRPEQVADLQARLDRVLLEFAEEHGDTTSPDEDPENQTWGLLIANYRLARRRDGDNTT